MNKPKIDKRVMVYLVAIILLLGSIAIITKPTITGFVTVDNITNETTNTTIENNITKEITTTINETTENDTKEKGKPEKAKLEPNQPPVWKSDVNEFIINGETIIDLNEYFEDKNNDTIGYAAIAPDKISLTIESSLITITAAGDSFNSTLTIVASDGDKSTTKELTLIIPERTITIDLEYKEDTIYDANNDGLEPLTGIIDLTIENSNFSWNVDENNLCTRWETFSVEDEESTFVCYGSNRCCQFVDLLATRPVWDEPFHSAFGTYGASFNNIVSAQVLYVDYDLSVTDPFAEIYNSEWNDLIANYFIEYSEFENICSETCSLTGFSQTSYKLIFEIENATLELDSLTYTILEPVDKVLVDIDVEDSTGKISGTFRIYKDNVLIIDDLIAPDYYDIEIIPSLDVIRKLYIYNANITAPLSVRVGVDNVSRLQEIKDVEIIKQYAIDASALDFDTATLTATATANSLWKCAQWDYSTEVCFGTWEKIKDLTLGEEYTLTITPDDPGFVEGNLNISLVNITPINVTELALINDIPNLTISRDINTTISLSNYFAGIDNDTIFTYNPIDNIDITFENNIATISTGPGFIGTRFTFITATKGDEVVISNVFSITVTAQGLVACSNFISTDDGLFYCKDDERFYTCSGFGEQGDLETCIDAKFVRNTITKSMCPFKHKDCNVTVDMNRGWGGKQIIEDKKYKLAVFQENLYCGAGHCAVPFYFKSKIDFGGNLSFETSSDVLLENISVKRVLEGKEEVDVGEITSMKQHDSNYYMLYFDYQPIWVGTGVKKGQTVKFNITAFLDGIKVLELDPSAHHDSGTACALDVDDPDDDVTTPVSVVCSDRGADAVLLVGINLEDTLGSIESVEHATNTMNLVTGSDLSGSGLNSWLYKFEDCTSDGTVIVKFASAGNKDDACISWSIYDGTDSVGDATGQTSIGELQNPSVSVTGLVGADMAFAFYARNDEGGADSCTFDNTERASDTAQPQTEVYAADDIGGSSVTMSWSCTIAEGSAITGVRLVGTPDIIPPRMNASLDTVTPYTGLKVTMKANVTDDFSLDTCSFFVNDTSDGSFIIVNKSVSGKSDTCNQNFTITLAQGNVLNFTVVVNDTAGGNINTSVDPTDSGIVGQIVTIGPAPTLFVNISSPKNNTEITVNTTFTLIVNVTCLNASCGLVTGLARYNDSGSNVPNKSISSRILGVTTFPVPLFINGTFDGSQLWSYEVSLGSVDIAFGVATDSQDNIIVVGRADNTDDDWNVTKLDSDGNQLWSYEVSLGTGDDARGVAVDSQDNIIVVGNVVNTESEDWNVTKLDSDGNQLWSYIAGVFGGSTSEDNARAVAVDSQDNIIVVGEFDFGSASFLRDWNVTKVDPDGNYLWSYLFDSGGLADIAHGVAVDSQDNIIVVGQVGPSTAAGDWNVTKVDPDGNYLWSYRYDSGGTDIARGVAVDSQDNIIVVGEAAGNWNVTKLDSDGNQLWSYEESLGTTDIARGVAVDSQDNIIVVGQADNTDDDWNVTKLDSNGNQLWSYEVSLGTTDIARGVAVDLQGNIIVVGSAANTNNDWNVTKLFGGNNPKSCGVMSKNEKCQLNWTINASGDVGSVLLVDVNFTSSISLVESNDTRDHLITIIDVVAPADNTKPRINASLDNRRRSQVYQNVIYNMTANVTDEAGLSFCKFLMNGTTDGGYRILNKSVTGTDDQCSQNWTIELPIGSVINFTVVVNDTSDTVTAGNLNQSEQIVTVSALNCTNLNKPNTIYNMTNNASSDGTCFNVLANNITLDGKGFMINYSQVDIGYGVNISSFNYTTIKSSDIVQSDDGPTGDAYGVYIYRNASNNKVFNNSVTTFGTTSHAVYLFQEAYNSSIYNNTITTSGSSGYGVRVSATSYDNSVYNNTITTRGSTGIGVYLLSTYNNSVYSNTITTRGSSGVGVFMGSTVYDNSVYNNTINTSGSSGYGIQISVAAYDNSVYSNTITTSGSSGYGAIFDFTAYNNSFYSNTITTSNITSYVYHIKVSIPSMVYN